MSSSKPTATDTSKDAKDHNVQDAETSAQTENSSNFAQQDNKGNTISDENSNTTVCNNESQQQDKSKLQMLPHNHGFAAGDHSSPELNPILRVILIAVYNDNHEFSIFRDNKRYLLKHIWEYANDINDWKPFIQESVLLTKNWYSRYGLNYFTAAQLDECIDSNGGYSFKREYYYEDTYKPAFDESDKKNDVIFPSPSDININMMPFIMSLDFSETKLPKSLEEYYDNIIIKCIKIDETQIDKIGYLTIQECQVKIGESQRRPGLHTETPGVVHINKGKGQDIETKHSVFWGCGYRINKMIHDGLYVASTVDNACAVWDCYISRHAKKPAKIEEKEDEESGQEKKKKKRKDSDEDIWSYVDDSDDQAAEKQKKYHMDLQNKNRRKKSDSDDEYKVQSIFEKEARNVIGYLGNIEHLRKCLPEKARHVLKKNKLYWMTDRTPHESLPLKESQYRQFFRLVTHKVSLWYEDHSTPNPFGLMPDKNITTIIKGNKFQNDDIRAKDDGDDADDANDANDANESGKDNTKDNANQNENEQNDR